jgi:hypothetical protein
MPKSGFAAQWCPCGSNLRPHIALSIAARSLHVTPRMFSENITIYCCEVCVQKFNRAIDNQSYFFRAVHERLRDAILSAIAGSVVAVWEDISKKLPK